MSLWPFKSNFTVIAENTTKYYLELKSRYQNRFENNISLLASAGVLDAQNYIFTTHPTINIDDILNLARDSTTDDESHVSTRELISFEERRQRYRRGQTSLADFITGDIEKDSETDISESIDILFDFVFGLELMIFRADSPKLSPYLIEEACRDKYKTIEKAIVQTVNRYKIGAGLVAKATTSFMESPSFQTIRQRLGIMDDV